MWKSRSDDSRFQMSLYFSFWLNNIILVEQVMECDLVVMENHGILFCENCGNPATVLAGFPMSGKIWTSQQFFPVEKS